jgi:holo-[acyl-carrier protein] synthase
MILGIGIDLESVARIRKAAERGGQRFLGRVYTAKELAYCQRQKDPWPGLTARWAAKEACYKAMSAAWKGGWQASDIEVLRDAQGRVSLALIGKMKLPKGTKLALSITHTKDQAAAVAIWEKI